MTSEDAEDVGDQIMHFYDRYEKADQPTLYSRCLCRHRGDVRFTYRHSRHVCLFLLQICQNRHRGEMHSPLCPGGGKQAGFFKEN